jgi:hypothetical protein
VARALVQSCQRSLGGDCASFHRLLGPARGAQLCAHSSESQQQLNAATSSAALQSRQSRLGLCRTLLQQGKVSHKRDERYIKRKLLERRATYVWLQRVFLVASGRPGRRWVPLFQTGVLGEWVARPHPPPPTPSRFCPAHTIICNEAVSPSRLWCGWVGDGSRGGHILY